MFKYFLLVVIAVFMVSCGEPASKESYLERFDKFVNRVENNHENYTQKDWEWADTQFEKYNSEWYLKFRDEFTLKDQIKIKGLIIEYHSYKNNEDVDEMLKELFKDDVENIREKVEEYIDNDMEEDLDKLIEGAAEIGDSAVKALEDIIEELDNSF
ncbi:MAG: DUF6565 domain-containing protein [Bacteroidota bacterium]